MVGGDSHKNLCCTRINNKHNKRKYYLLKANCFKIHRNTVPDWKEHESALLQISHLHFGLSCLLFASTVLSVWKAEKEKVRYSVSVLNSVEQPLPSHQQIPAAGVWYLLSHSLEWRPLLRLCSLESSPLHTSECSQGTRTGRYSLCSTKLLGCLTDFLTDK